MIDIGRYHRKVLLHLVITVSRLGIRVLGRNSIWAPGWNQRPPYGHRHNNKCKKEKRGSRCTDNYSGCNANLSCDRIKMAYTNGEIHP